MKCPNCGRRARGGSPFCLNCGYRLPAETEDRGTGESEPGEEAPAGGAQASREGGSAPGVGNSMPPKPAEHAPRKSTLIALGVIGFLLVVLLLGTTLYFAGRAFRAEDREHALQEENATLREGRKSLDLRLDDISKIVDTSIEILDHYFSEEGKKLSTWQELVLDTLKSIRDILEAAEDISGP